MFVDARRQTLRASTRTNPLQPPPRSRGAPGACYRVAACEVCWTNRPALSRVQSQNPHTCPWPSRLSPLAFAVICIVHTSSTCTPPPRVLELLNAPGSPRQRPSTQPSRGRRAPSRAPDGPITRNVRKARRRGHPDEAGVTRVRAPSRALRKARRRGHPDEAGVTRVRAPSRAPRTGWVSLSSALRTWPRSRDPRDCPHASPSASPHPRSRPRASEHPPVMRDAISGNQRPSEVIRGHGQANAHL